MPPRWGTWMVFVGREDIVVFENEELVKEAASSRMRCSATEAALRYFVFMVKKEGTRYVC